MRGGGDSGGRERSKLKAFKTSGGGRMPVFSYNPPRDCNISSLLGVS